jgi:uncharacterized protein YndB with AHSA1/START domain
MPAPLATTAVANAEMLIRKPVDQVFEAFVDPRMTTNFWFTRSSGRLESGKHVTWDWEMYNLSLDVIVRVIEPHKRIVIEWSSKGSAPTTVEWRFIPRADDTYVSVTNTGFIGDPYSLVDQVRNATEGLALLLAGAKAFLEHNLRLNLIRDRHPDGLGKRITAAST